MTNTKHLEGATCDTPDDQLIPVEALLAGFLRALLREQREGFGKLTLSARMDPAATTASPSARRLTDPPAADPAPRRPLAVVSSSSSSGGGT